MKPLLIIASLLLTSPAWAVPIDYILSTVNQTDQTAQFEIHFDAPPNFTLVDQFGRQQDSFDIVAFDAPRTDNLGFSTGNYDSVAYGPSILAGHGLSILGPHDQLMQTVPFILEGPVLIYSASLAAMGVAGHSPFGYGFITGIFGDSSQSGLNPGFFGRCTSGIRCDLSVPEPGTGWSMGLGLLGIIFLAARYGLRRQP
jgi:hypothetical protein